MNILTLNEYTNSHSHENNYTPTNNYTQIIKIKNETIIII